VSPEAREHSLDELARGLASGNLSRAKALKLMGATLVGGALASIPGIAMAKPKPAGRKCNHDHQCESGQCVSGECQPSCIPNGDPCTEATAPQCCSGNCSNGFCCPTGYVGLSNGTCAKTCTTNDDCPGCSFCGGDIGVCAGSSTSQSCTSDIDCPSGQFCAGGPPNRFCRVVC